MMKKVKCIRSVDVFCEFPQIPSPFPKLHKDKSSKQTILLGPSSLSSLQGAKYRSLLIELQMRTSRNFGNEGKEEGTGKGNTTSMGYELSDHAFTCQ